MNELYAWLNEQNGGIRTYGEFHAKAQQLAREDAENAAILALLGRVAARFVSRYEGEPLPVDSASTAIAQFRDLVATAISVRTGADAEKLAFANRVATTDLLAG